jgi:hypothetical protein
MTASSNRLRQPGGSARRRAERRGTESFHDRLPQTSTTARDHAHFLDHGGSGVLRPLRDHGSGKTTEDPSAVTRANYRDHDKPGERSDGNPNTPITASRNRL